MNWAHLPVAGGIYDQHPQLIDEWFVLFAEKAAHDKQEEERAKREREAASRRRR